MAQKCHTPAGAGAARAAVFENNASENSRPAPQVNSEGTAPTRPTCADPDPLFHQKGEKIADWMRRWRGLGLLEPWPACLPLDRLPIPLAIGVRDQLLQRLNTAVRAPERFARLLGHYCHQRIYLTGLARHGAQRHDIGGQAVEPVDPEHQRHARDQLYAQRQKRRRREEAAAKAQATAALRQAKAQAMAALRRANAARSELRLGGPRP